MVLPAQAMVWGTQAVARQAGAQVSVPVSVWAGLPVPEPEPEPVTVTWHDAPSGRPAATTGPIVLVCAHLPQVVADDPRGIRIQCGMEPSA